MCLFYRTSSILKIDVITSSFIYEHINNFKYSIMKYICTVFMLFVTCVYTLYAHNLKGKIITEDNKPIENAALYNETTGYHTHTDDMGNFVLDNTKVDDIVVVTNLGYETKTLFIGQEDLGGEKIIVLTESSVSLKQVVLTSEVNVLSKIVNVDIDKNPVKSSQEILQKVPGLIIGQHAGGGKAEQIFLRGFDVDHGTDVAVSVDGMPVNMVSHAHGQGYADLHFVIPETIKEIDFGKGPYYADQGNFNTAGYVNLGLKKTIDQNLISVEAGQFGTSRLVGMFKLLSSEKSSAYIASELYLLDGYFDSPQNFNRVNVIGKYNYKVSNNEELNLTFSHFQSKWNASGQIPERAVEQGLIDRFGAIDDTEGGNTSRTNFQINHEKKIDENTSLKSNAFATAYDFELYSNFTFFLEDPINGDQIRQKENRLILGAESVYNKKNIDLGNSYSLKYNAGIGFRYDDIDDVELSSTLNRDTLIDRISYGDTDEVNTYAFLNSQLKINNWKINPSLRLDYFKFDYENKLTEVFDNKSESALAISPKLNTIYTPNQNWQFFLKSGIGFHSNDARVVVENDGEDILPAAYGVDLGTVVKPIDKLALNATVWSLFLDQEFVYVGDAGIVEPSGRTRRLGVEFGARYQVTDWLYAYSDINYTYGRSVDEPNGEDYIPLAPDLTSVGGINIENVKGFSGGLSYRFVDDRAANEDNSIVADGYFITDFNVNYKWKNWTLGVIIENLFDTEWKETQFATESRLFNETEPTEEIHFTPGTPFYLRGKVSVSF